MLELGPALLILLVEEGRHGRDLGGLIEEPDGLVEMIERRRGRQVPAPQLGGVTDGAAGESLEVGLERLGQARSRAPESPQEGIPRVAAHEELAGWQERRRLERPDAPLVGGIEAAQRVDLVAEPLDAHRPGLAGRKHVEDAPAPGELPSPAHLRHGLVAEVYERPRQPLHGHPAAAPKDERLGGDVVRAEGPLEERLEARDQDAWSTVGPPPGSQRRHPGG